MSGVLYVSYDGVLEPLGQSQVVAYLEGLAAGHRIHLVSFEKAGDWSDTRRRDEIAVRLRKAGIGWHPRRYHKRFSVLTTAYDIGIGTLTALWLRLRHRLRVLHSRSDVATLMAWIVARTTGARLIFDMRGFWADERVEAGLWPAGGRLHRIGRWFERRFLRSADHVVSLTRAGVRVLDRQSWLQGRMPPTTVIPTCSDLRRFRPEPQDRPAGFVFGYVCAIGTWQLFDEAARCFTLLRRMREDARMLIVNRSDHAYIRERLVAARIPMDAVELRSADHGEMPSLMTRMSAGVIFNRATPAKQASTPTKLGEYLGCGIPCLSNTGVGDVAEILESERIGVAIDAYDDATLESGLRRLLALTVEPDIAGRCVAAAQKYFSLERGVAAYDAIYRELDAS
jgi:glycosyltransferase involved in cell wall biosynthesis